MPTPPMANSVMLLVPTITAPAARSLVHHGRVAALPALACAEHFRACGGHAARDVEQILH